MGQPTQQEIEERKASTRVKDYIAGVSRLVLISRLVVGGLFIVIWIVLWWQG